MEFKNSEDLDRLLEDISTIKSVLKQNASILRQIPLPRHFRIMSALGGILIMADCYLYFQLNSRYGLYENFPANIQRIFIGVLIATWLILGVWWLWSQSLKRFGSKISNSRALKEFFLPRQSALFRRYRYVRV